MTTEATVSGIAPFRARRAAALDGFPATPAWTVASGLSAPPPTGTVTSLLGVRRHYDILDAAVAAHAGVRPIEQGRTTARWPPSPGHHPLCTPALAGLRRTDPGLRHLCGPARRHLEGPADLRPLGTHAYAARARNVIDLVAEGLTNAQIAGRLFIADGIVKVHLRHIFAKLDISRRSELAAPATERRLP